MVIDLCAFAMTAVMTVIIGGPVAARLARITIFAAPSHVDPQGARQAQHITVFQPVDFGPDLMIWPSEHPRPDAGRPQPPWPSAKWDDPHFGKGASATARQQFDAADSARQEGRTATKRSEAAPPLVKPAPKQAAPKQAAPQAKPVQQRAAPQKQAQRQPAQPKPKASVEQRVQQSGQPKAAQQPKAPPRAAPQPSRAAPPAAAAPQAPTPQETSDAIERLVAERGLAGAVQFLMQQNGWDFRTAASFLASHRKR